VNEDADINLELYDNIDIEIDSHSDIEPSYHLLEENNGLSVMEECDKNLIKMISITDLFLYKNYKFVNKA
jgi:hypothetical protein